MQDYRKLLVWEKGHALALQIYRTTAGFPEQERYGLISQMRRAAYSIPANIAEGCGRSGKSELRQFLHLALGCASELDYFLLLARDLGYSTPHQYDLLEKTVREIKLMLAGLIRKVGEDMPPRHAAKRNNALKPISHNVPASS